MAANRYFLFSVDLEDLRRLADEGEKVGERLPMLLNRYLEFLDRVGCRCTFFVVGETARDYPDLIREIHNKGHEIACHTDRHITLDRHTPESFEADLRANIASITALGLPAPVGFRAPSLSLIEKCRWVYGILERNGFTYSSSVLPAGNPLFGWPGFGENPRKVGQILEIPVTLTPFSFLKIPMGAGIYFRVLPEFILRLMFALKAGRGEDIVGYFHPYDIDAGQPKVMHPGIGRNRFYNFLMYYNRKDLMKRIERRLKQGFQIVPYREYLKNLVS